MTRATWQDHTIADSSATVTVEGNHYFPRESLEATLVASPTEYTCPWKGAAAYFDVVVGDETLKDGAWSYPTPKPAAAEIAGMIAFDRKISVSN